MIETAIRPSPTFSRPPIDYSSSLQLSNRVQTADEIKALLESTLPELPSTRELEPSEMTDYQAPKAGVGAKRVYQEGRAKIDAVADKPIESWTFDDFYTQANAFIQISGVQGNSPTGNVASFSEELYLRGEKTSDGRSLSAGAIAFWMGLRVAGNLNYKWYGERKDKLLFFVEENHAPEEMLQRLTDAPRRPLIDKISQYQNELQNRRNLELQDTDQGDQFRDFFYDKRSELKRAFQRNGRYSFVWNWHRRGGDLIAKNPDDKEQGAIDLYENAPDDGTREMLKDEHEYLTGYEGKNRFVVKITFDQYVIDCCPTASVSQRIIDTAKRHNLALPGIGLLSISMLDSKPRIFLPAEKKKCSECKSYIEDGKCHCNQEQENNE